MNSPTPDTPAYMYGQAIEALNRADWLRASSLADRLLSLSPGHAGVHFVAGVAALQLQQLSRALHLLNRAVELNPGRADYTAQFARAFSASRMMREAVETADRAAALSSEDPATLDTLGVVYSQANEYAKAAEVFRRAATLMPDIASFRFNLATSLTFGGDVAGAEAEYEACLSLDPRYWKAHLALAQLRKQEQDSNHIGRLNDLLAAAPGEGAMYLHLALSKEYEDLGELDRSFEHLTTGKAAGRQGRSYSPARDAALFQALELAFPERLQAAQGSQSAEPIFIVGMPRSGTTLVDRILSSHSLVHSAGELQNFGAILKRASGSRTRHLLDPDTLARARDLDWRRLGDAYVASTRPGTGHTPHFIDKLPHNFLFAGHIAQALPNARIICLRRNPMDTCLSNFRQLFVQGSSHYDYSFDLLDTGRYYLLFDRLMTHWQRVLPGRILEIDYEAIVEDQEACTRQLLDFCRLPWEEACMHFERNEAPVATASAVQVRSPIYRSALKRWQKYERHLEPLRELLEEAGIEIG